MSPLVGNSLESEEERSLSSSESDDGVEVVTPRVTSVSTRARQLGIDAVECTHPRNLSSLPLPIIDVLIRDDVSIVMRKIVKKIVLEKRPLFHGMIQSVRPAADFVAVEDFQSILTDVVGHLVYGVSDHSAAPNLTWGKVVTAYAFGGLFANAVLTSSCSSESWPPADRVRHLGTIVGEVVDDLAGAWIAQQGGWNSFAKYFCTINTEESITRNLVYLFGASAAAAVGLVCWKTMVH